MAHIREIRPQARELKFVVDAGRWRSRSASGLERISTPISTAADPLATSTGPTSVYFDNDAFDVFHRRGSFGRSKYRIRRYGDDETVFLERKMRQPAVLAKRRTTLPLAALSQIIDAEARCRMARLLVPSARQRPGGSGRSAGRVFPDGHGACCGTASRSA